MNDPAQPGIELAPLPRDRVGPFLILGVPKDADAESIERHWARCVLWARQGKTRTALGDIHWAREILRDTERRLAADIGSLNLETSGDELRRLNSHYHLDPPQAAWMPVEPESMAAADLPDPDVERAKLPPPDVPVQLPAVQEWLTAWARAGDDPWAVSLPSAAARGESNE